MPRPFAIAAALAFAAFVTAKGIPTLRHDWNWPIDRTAVPSFLTESIGGWMPIGFGALNAHPTTYLIAPPLGVAMAFVGPLVVLVLLAVAIAYLCLRTAENLSHYWHGSMPATIGLGAFVLFNPWVYNEIVAGHLLMVLAYGGIIGLLAEMVRGTDASPPRLALWLVPIEAQLQFFILAVVALVIFALATKKWLPPIIGLILGLPSFVGLFAERTTILSTPYSLTWQANQSVAPAALAALGGYFPGYSDRLGIECTVAVWLIVVLAVVGAIAFRRRRGVVLSAAAAIAVYVIVTGVRGPFAVPYEWIVREIPESGLFRELYDLAGILAAVLALLAFAGTRAFAPLRYVALLAGLTLPLTWLFAPPSHFWVGGASYPHPSVAAPPFSRIALMPAFQPLALHAGDGDGADPDAHTYFGNVASLNEYLPTYPVDMVLARYQQFGDVDPLRALGVTEIVPRNWLRSVSNGSIGLAAASLHATAPVVTTAFAQRIEEATPLVSQCERPRIVALGNILGACNVFFGDTDGGYPSVTALHARGDSIDPRTDWIDARLGFAAVPALAQGIGGVLTQSRITYQIEPRSALLAYVDGRLNGPNGRTLAKGGHGLQWITVPSNVVNVVCEGLCELVAQTRSLPRLPTNVPPSRAYALPFKRILPWFYVIAIANHTAPLVRLNERYDAGWTALAGWHVLPHVRVDMSANGWFLAGNASNTIILVQLTSFLQMLAELCGVLCAAWLLKAVLREPTKRAS